MATYLEMSAIKSMDGWNDLQKRIRHACTEKAAVILQLSAPTSAQIAWAEKCLADPVSVSNSIENYVIAAAIPDSAVITAAFGASDSVIQTHVDNAVDKIAV